MESKKRNLERELAKAVEYLKDEKKTKQITVGNTMEPLLYNSHRTAEEARKRDKEKRARNCGRAKIKRTGRFYWRK